MMRGKNICAMDDEPQRKVSAGYEQKKTFGIYKN
jgi:hypothetical protein